jgi:hypothetical protein
MALKLSIVDPFASRPWSDVALLELRRGGITEAQLKVAVNEPSQLNFKINTNLGSDWQYLRDNFDTGLKVIGKRYDSIFVKGRQPQFDRDFGVVNLGFFGASYLLKNSQKLNSDLEYNGSVQTLISRLDPNFAFISIGADRNIKISTGQMNNLELLNECMKAAGGFIWFDGVTVDTGAGYKPSIYYGAISDIQATLGLDPHFAPLYIDDRAALDNPFSPDFVILNSVKKNYSGEIYTHLQVLGDVGQATAINSRLKLVDPGASYINAEFPLVSVINSITGASELYIINTRATPLTKRYSYNTQTYTLSANSQDSELRTIRSIDDAREYMYNKGVAWLKQHTYNESYNVDYTLNQICYPGTAIVINRKDTATQIDGSKLEVFNFQNKTQFIRENTFNLLNINN